MFIEVETHCHTLASGHAFSTLEEVIQMAKKKGMKAVSFTEHAPGMPGGPNIYHIINQQVIPKEIEGIRVYKGVEANIIDFDGNLDIEDSVIERLDLVIASLHSVCIKPGTKEENTRAIIKAMENKNVDIIGHPGNPDFPIDKEVVVKKAIETNTLIEINNSSFLSSRKGSFHNCKEIAKLCNEYGANIVCGSDAHISYDVGRCDKSSEMLDSINFNYDLIVNLKFERFKEHFFG
ncbi:MAG: phosphatase [Andreesenia angusta]|nr:phosphatase [Andreesenia angusta]